VPRRLERVCYDVPEWTPGTADAKPAAAATTAVTFDAKPASKMPLPFINIAAWQDQAVPDRAWTVRDRIPASNVTLLSGEGSVGKSILSIVAFGFKYQLVLHLMSPREVFGDIVYAREISIGRRPKSSFLRLLSPESGPFDLFSDHFF
jgi:hypothetical protein